MPNISVGRPKAQPTTDATHEELFPSYPQSIRFVEDEPVIGRFDSVHLGPESPDGYGRATIVYLVGESGTYEDREGALHQIVPGEKYSVWLINQVLETRFRDLKPEVGEKVAIIFDGRRSSKTRKDKNGEAVEYSVFRVSCPDRVRDEGPTTWDTLPPF